MTLSELFAVACGLSLLFLFASFWQGDDSGGLGMHFWIFQDKPNKRIAIHRSECGTRNVGQGPPSEGRSWHGPYPSMRRSAKRNRCLHVKALK